MQRLTVIRSRPKLRAVAHYNLQLPVIFEWSDETNHVNGGFTKDIARDSAFILSDKCPPLGSDVRMKILFPSPVESGALYIECTGKVDRISDGRGCRGFRFHGWFDDTLLMVDPDTGP